MAAPVRVKIAASGAGQVRKEVNSINRILGTIGTGAGALLGAAGVQGVRAFASVEEAARQVVTLLPNMMEATDAEIDAAALRVQQQIENVATETGQDAERVGAAFYQGLSAGVAEEDTIEEYTRQVARAATAGSADIVEAMDFAAAATNAFEKDTGDLTAVMDSAFATVQVGSTTLPELSAAYSNVAGSAHAANVPMEQMNAQIATLTLSGVQTKVASNLMKQQFVQLGDETTQLGSLFQDLSGVKFRDFMAEGGNLNDALNLIADHAEETDQSIFALAGNIEAAQAIVYATGGASESFENALNTMDESIGLTDKNFRIMSGGVQFAMNQTKAEMDELMAKIGELVSKLLDDLLPAFQRVANFLDHDGRMTAVLVALGVLFGVSLVMKIATLITNIRAITTALLAMKATATTTATAGIGAKLLAAFAPIMVGGAVTLAIAATIAALGVLLYKANQAQKTRIRDPLNPENPIYDPTARTSRDLTPEQLARQRAFLFSNAPIVPEFEIPDNPLRDQGTPHSSVRESQAADVSRWEGYVTRAPGMAKGGIVTDPTLAVVGEGKHDEAVLPLPDNWRISSRTAREPERKIVNNVTINTQAVVGNEHELMSMINEGLNEYFRHNPARNMRYAGSKF